MEDLKYFFSYARKDSEFVLRVAKDLRAVGASLWLDQLDIVAGQRWDRAVEEALKICQGLIVVLSPESLASDNVMDEVSYALEEEKMVLPIVVRPCDIPFRLRRVQHIEFTANYETGFSQLLRAMRLEQPLQPIQPTAPEAPVVHDDTAPSEEKSMESPGMSRPPRFRISLIAARIDHYGRFTRNICRRSNPVSEFIGTEIGANEKSVGRSNAPCCRQKADNRPRS